MCGGGGCMPGALGPGGAARYAAKLPHDGQGTGVAPACGRTGEGPHFLTAIRHTDAARLGRVQHHGARPKQQEGALEGTFARRARHPNQCSGPLSPPKHHSLLRPRLPNPCHAWEEWLHHPCLLGPQHRYKKWERGVTTGKIGETLPSAHPPRQRTLQGAQSAPPPPRVPAWEHLEVAALQAGWLRGGGGGGARAPPSWPLRRGSEGAGGGGARTYT